MPPTPLLDRMTGLIAWLADRIAGLSDHTGGDRAGLEPSRVGALLARLRHLAARFRAVAGTPIPPPRPAPKPAEPSFVPTHSFRVVAADPPPERHAPPRAWRWLLRRVPQLAAGRAQLEDLLRDPATQEMLAADPRLGPILRPLGWMLGVERALLPAARRRRPATRALGRRPLPGWISSRSGACPRPIAATGGWSGAAATRCRRRRRRTFRPKRVGETRADIVRIS